MIRLRNHHFVGLTSLPQMPFNFGGLHLQVLAFFLDIRSGCQLVIMATAEYVNSEGGKDLFTQWGHYLQDFDHSDTELFSENNFEAIRLEPGNRL